MTVYVCKKHISFWELPQGPLHLSLHGTCPARNKQTLSGKEICQAQHHKMQKGEKEDRL